jgi:hypothetical protein
MPFGHRCQKFKPWFGRVVKLNSELKVRNYRELRGFDWNCTYAIDWLGALSLQLIGQSLMKDDAGNAGCALCKRHDPLGTGVLGAHRGTLDAWFYT